MNELMEKVELLLGEEFIRIIISNPREKDGVKKIVLRPVMIKDTFSYQAEEYDDKQVKHHNMNEEEVISYVEEKLTQGFRQLEGMSTCRTVLALVSKKGKVTCKEKKCQNDGITKKDMSHNREKKYILKEGTPIPFLADLGVMTKEGKIVDKKYKKFRQINRFLEFIRDVLDQLPANRELTIIDFGCGKSYLTFAMYYYIKVLNKRPVKMIGLDLKEDVIEHCNELAKKYEYDEIQFLKGDIKDYDGVDTVDMVVTLHACDTATDYALAKAIEWDAKVILSVPCCQHELNKQTQSELLAPAYKYGIIKERMSALLTDAMRANILEENGYDAGLLEFVDMEHTPKNILLRAVRNGSNPKGISRERKRLLEELHGNLTLDQLIKEMRSH